MMELKELLRAVLLLGAMVFGGCEESATKQSAGLTDTLDDGGVDTETGLSTTKIEQIMSEALVDAPAGVDGMSLIVHNEDDERIIEISVGDFDPDRRVPIASASKLVSGLVLMRLVEEGALEMTDTPRSILGWTETTAADATLDHLGAFVSGLPVNVLCVYFPQQTLQECVETIRTSEPLAGPGERFDYGSTHQAVQAAMAEIAASESWASLFERTLKIPLGLSDPDLRYVTLPKQQAGGDNPLVAGGLVATTEEYISLLAVLFHKGKISGKSWISPQLMERFGQNLYPDVVQGETPPASLQFGFRYGWSSWLGCSGAVEKCPVVSSPGAFGFSPWVDWEHRYYAILAMESDQAGGGSLFSVPLMESIRPEIENLMELSN